MVIKVILLAIALIAIAMLGMAVKILLKKNGQFPGLHIGADKNMKKHGIHCAQTFDKIEQTKAREEIRFSKIKLADK